MTPYLYVSYSDSRARKDKSNRERGLRRLEKSLRAGRLTKSNINNLAAPTSVLTKKVALKGSLKIPNVTRDFSENSWQTFLDFSFRNYFFILEQDQEGDVLFGSSAYLCFDPSNPKVTAHNSTRLMNNIALQFKVFTGL